MSSMNSIGDEKKPDSGSEAEPNGQPGALYDFLYRDAGRIASYYAQLFKGRLTQLEETDSDRSEKEQRAKLSAYVASGYVNSKDEILSTSKRVVDPHDLIATDVLSDLISEGRVNSDISTATHGSLVIHPRHARLC